MSASDRSNPPQVVQDDMIGDDLSLRSLFTAAWRGRWILLVCTAAGAFAGFRKVQQQGDIWKAESRLYIQGQAAIVIGGDSLRGSGARNGVPADHGNSRRRQDLNVDFGSDNDVVAVSLLAEQSADLPQRSYFCVSR